MSFFSAALEGTHSDDNSAAPLLPLAKSEKQENDVVREGSGAQSKSAASVCSVEDNCCPKVLRRLLRKRVDYIQVPGVRAASAVRLQCLSGLLGLRSAASLPPVR